MGLQIVFCSFFFVELLSRIWYIERIYVMFAVGTGFFVLTAMFIQRQQFLIQAVTAFTSIKLLLCLAFLGIVSSILAFCMLNYAMNELTVGQATSYSNLTTIVSMFAGAVFLGEPLSLLHLAGSITILIGVCCSNQEHQK